MELKNEIVVYQPKDSTKYFEVNIADDTIWMRQQQIVELFDSSKANISEHIKNIFLSGELDGISVVRNFRTTATDGKKYNVKHYNLDVVISIGYRVNSIKGTQFRIWANKILKDYLLKGYSINQRVNRLEDNVQTLISKVNEIDFQINTNSIPTQGVFFNGQVFDAYKLASDIIRSAQKSIILIDNYIDETTLTHLTKKQKNVPVLLLTKNITKQLELDIKKANEQYPIIKYHSFAYSHDRFLIIDNEIVYHLGASLKDLGKKWFAFSMIDKKSVSAIIDALTNLIK